MRAALLALLLALPVQAQEAPRAVIEVQDGYIRDRQGQTLQVRGGAYLPSESLLATGKELAALRAENAALKAAPVAPPASLMVAMLTGITIGLAGGVAFAFWVRR